MVWDLRSQQIGGEPLARVRTLILIDSPWQQAQKALALPQLVGAHAAAAAAAAAPPPPPGPPRSWRRPSPAWPSVCDAAGVTRGGRGAAWPRGRGAAGPGRAGLGSRGRGRGQAGLD